MTSYLKQDTLKEYLVTITSTIWVPAANKEDAEEMAAEWFHFSNADFKTEEIDT
jgi:hypothetical protein